MSARFSRIGAVVLVAIAALVFYIRTAGQSYYVPSDFAVYYTAARAWMSGGNPYDRAAAPEYWIGAGGRSDIMPLGFVDRTGTAWMPILQLPSALPVLAPLAVLPAKIAVFAWYVLAALLVIAQTAALARLIDSTLLQPRGLLLLAITLMLAPVHEMFGYAQPSGPVISFIIIAIWAATTRRDILAGLLLGVAATVKPHLAAAFIVYYLLLGRWRISGAVATAFVLACAMALAPMQMRGTPWLATWGANLSSAEAPGGENDVSLESGGRYYMLHLPVILHGLMTNAKVVNALSLIIVAALAGLFAWFRARAARHDELLSLAIISILALLPVNHRFYDAAILIVPFAWAIIHLRDRPAVAWPIVAIVLSFVIPVAGVLRFARLLGSDPNTLSIWWWNLFIEPIRIWALLAGLVVLVAALKPDQVRSPG